MKRVRVVVEGRVQGVGFRDSTPRSAVRHGVDGWVRNLPDGRVEALLEGDAAAVDAVVEFMSKGPAYARVDAIEVDEAAPGPAAREFRITR